MRVASRESWTIQVPTTCVAVESAAASAGSVQQAAGQVGGCTVANQSAAGERVSTSRDSSRSTSDLSDDDLSPCRDDLVATSLGASGELHGVPQFHRGATSLPIKSSLVGHGSEWHNRQWRSKLIAARSDAKKLPRQSLLSTANPIRHPEMVPQIFGVVHSAARTLFFGAEGVKTVVVHLKSGVQLVCDRPRMHASHMRNIPFDCPTSNNSAPSSGHKAFDH